MSETLERSLANHRNEIEGMEVSLKRLEALRDKVNAEINALESLNTANGQMLLFSRPRLENLENAVASNRQSYRVLDERIETLRKQFESTSLMNRQTAELIELSRKQIDEIRESGLSNPQKKLLEDATWQVFHALQEKKKLGERMLEICEELLDSVQDAMEAKKAIDEKLTDRLKSLRKASLYMRFDPYTDFSVRALLEDLRYSENRFNSIFNRSTWEMLWTRIKMGGFEHWGVFIAVLVSIGALQAPGRRMLRRVEEDLDGRDNYYRHLAVYLIRRSLLLLGMSIFFGIYCSLGFSILNIGLERILFLIFILLTTTRWALDYIEHEAGRTRTDLSCFLRQKLVRFFLVFRTLFIFSIALVWVVGVESLLSWIVKSAISAVYLVWTVGFWRGMKRVLIRSARKGLLVPKPARIALLRAWSYMVIGGAFLLNLLGYRILGSRWFVTWTETVVVLFWGWILLNALLEWGKEIGGETRKKGDNQPSSAHYVRLSLFKFSCVVLFFAVAAAIFRFWDPTGFLADRLGYFFGLTLNVGSLKLSIKGIALATAIIFVTLSAVRVGQRILDEKILKKRSFERGLKDTILTIAGYLGWALGLMLALGAVGVDGTSLAVVFGALSIGIGFGLQNIFNNFISGLILLLERPIQVGDTVEINGIWAEVKKINVRATVVQTYDNASLIIPNSEFISKEVTNWSFKDKRMRRSLDVGVAYGSNVDLVMNTLLEIVKDIPEVLKYPKPETIFMEHADSALIFRLRIWVHVDNYWSVTSRVRCEIDRRFRESDIEIAFPQRDLHIRSFPKEIAGALSSMDSIGISSRLSVEGREAS